MGTCAAQVRKPRKGKSGEMSLEMKVKGLPNFRNPCEMALRNWPAPAKMPCEISQATKFLNVKMACFAKIHYENSHCETLYENDLG